MSTGTWVWVPDDGTVRAVTAAEVRANLRESDWTASEIRVAMQVCRKTPKLACSVNGGAYQFMPKVQS